jgi:hypothetical protein
MKNPFRNIRWRRVPRRLAKGLLRVALAVAAILVLVVLGLDVYCEVQGLPDWAVDMLQGELTRRGIRSEFREVRVGVLSAVTAEDATLVTTRNGMDITLRADRVRARLGIRALLSRRPFVKTLDLSGATVSFADPARKALLPHLFECSAELRPQAGGAYAITVRGMTEGVNLRLSGRIRNAEALWHRRPPKQPDDRRWIERLEQLTRALRNCRFGNGDATVEATLDLDAANWRDYAVMGTWNVNNIMLQGTLAQTFKGQFTASPKQVVLRDLMVRLNREEHLYGKVVLEPGHRRIWAELEGQCTPETAFRLADQQNPEWLQRLAFTAPLGFKAVLHPSPLLAPRRWQVDLSCEASGFALRDMPVKHVQADIRYKDQVLKIPAFTFDIATGSDAEQATGKATIWPEKGEFELSMDAVLDWRSRCRQLGIWLPAAFRRLRTGDRPPNIQVDLDRSSYDWRKWHGKATIRTDQIEFAGTSGDDLQADVHFGGDTVRIENLRLGLGTPGTKLTGRLDAKLPGADQDWWQLDYDLAAIHRDGAEPTELATLAGSVNWYPRTERFSARGEGATRLARMLRSLGSAFGLPDNDHLQRIRCNDKPVRIRFTVPECSTDLRSWRINADIKGENVSVRELSLRDVESHVSLTPGQVNLTGLAGTTPLGETFKLNLGIGFSPVLVSVGQGELHGNPALVEAFIGGRRARQIYRRIWQDLSWDPDHPPLFRVPSLLYRQDRESKEWHLDMQGTLEAEQVALHGTRAKRLSLGVKLDLPGKVLVRDVVFTTEEAVVKGHVEVGTDGVPSCDFRFSSEDGGCDPRVVVRMIQPSLEEYLGSMDFAKDSRVSCEGSFFLAKDPRLNLSGTLQTPRWHWGKVDLTDVTAKWGVRGSEVRWDISRSTCCEGTVRSTGVYDAVTRLGDLAIEGEGASLNAVIANFQLGTPKPEHEAKLAVSGRVRFLRDWAGRPLQLTGAGQVNISEGNLWRVPVLSQLGGLLDVPLLRRLSLGKATGLGKITALRADLMFDGERVSIPNLVTDGTVVSLSGSGEYSWRQDRIEFDMVGEAFRQLPVVSIFTRTLSSWAFNARLSGTSKDYKWRLNNALKRAIVGEGESNSRRLDNP